MKTQTKAYGTVVTVLLNCKMEDLMVPVCKGTRAEPVKPVDQVHDSS